jgi:outer membrane receptor for monomeric catechols
MNPSGDFQRTRDWQNQIIYAWNIGDRLSVTNSFFKRQNRDQYLDAESMTYNATLDQVNRAYLYFQHNQRPTQNQTDVSGDYTIAGMRHRPFVRYEFSDKHRFTYRTGNAPGANNALNLPLPPVPVSGFIAGTWVDTAPVYRDFPITRVDFRTDRLHSVVLQDQLYPVEWLGVNLSMRRGGYRRETHNDTYDDGVLVSPGNDGLIRNQAKNNYRAGFVVIPTETWPSVIRGAMPYFSYNSSFNPVNQVQADGTPLEPVINESFEVGNRWYTPSSRFSILTAVRRIQDKNRVVNLGMQMFEQIGTTSTYNADVDMQGNVGGGLWLLANWGYADSRIDPLRADGSPQPNAGRRFPHAPKHTARLSITKSFDLAPSTSLNVNVGGRYVSEYFLNSANTVVMPDRTTFDGAVTLRRGAYDVALNLGNLLDRNRYFVSQINGGGLLYPGQPFNAALTLRYRFQ